MTKIMALLILGFGISSLSAAPMPSADQVREEFWGSKDSELKLAAEALGDDGIMEMYQKMRHQPGSDSKTRRIIEKLDRKAR